MQLGPFSINSSRNAARSTGFKNAPFWVFILLGLAMIAGGIYFINDGRKTAQWPKVEAIVRDVKTDVDYDADGNQEAEHRYTLSYTVNGIEFTENMTSDRYYSVGTTMPIIYNPDKPSDNRTGATGEWIGWLMAVAGLVIAIFSAIFTFSKRVRDATLPQQVAPTQQPQVMQVSPPIQVPAAPQVPQPPQQTPPQPPQPPQAPPQAPLS